MTQFRIKKDGSHYPIKGGQKVYPKEKAPVSSKGKKWYVEKSPGHFEASYGKIPDDYEYVKSISGFNARYPTPVYRKKK